MAYIKETLKGNYAVTVDLGILQPARELLEVLHLLEEEMAFTCPNCSATLADKSWLDVLFEDEEGAEPKSRIESWAEDWDLSSPGEIPIERIIGGRWLRCLECNHVLVRFSQIRRRPVSGEFPKDWPELGAESWLVVPRRSTRPVSTEVDNAVSQQAQLYREAAAILDDSPRGSAVLSRRVLADLLRKYAGRTERNLENQIDEFIRDSSVPLNLRENLHHFREAANFAAHTQEDDQANIVDVDRDEADWTLDILDRLFDYFIVSPARDAAIRAKMDKKIDATGRKPIKPPPP